MIYDYDLQGKLSFIVIIAILNEKCKHKNLE